MDLDQKYRWRNGSLTKVDSQGNPISGPVDLSYLPFPETSRLISPVAHINTKQVLPATMDALPQQTPQAAAAADDSSTNQPTTPEKIGFTKEELARRDREAVAYSKNLLVEGDTLVFISYPGDSKIFDSTGFEVTAFTHLVHSSRLLANGSKVFKELLGPTAQYRIKRRKKLVGSLPHGVNYVLDLTPPDEGEEAVVLTSDLSCSLGVRNWYKSADICGVSNNLVGGEDEVLDARNNATYSPVAATGLHGQNDFSPIAPQSSLPLSLPESQVGSTWKDLEERRHNQEMNTALQLSLEELARSRPKNSVNDNLIVPEYCPVRHRAGIARLLKALEGRDPRLDSAPKVWTLFVLAKHFDCTAAVVDWIIAWLMADPNTQFIEILPEVSIRMAYGLKNYMLCRAAFSILVSEEAISVASREALRERAGGESLSIADCRGRTRLGRIREDVDEDHRTIIEYASKIFFSRVGRTFEALTEENMSWLTDLQEYQKLQRFKAYVIKVSGNQAKPLKWLSAIDQMSFRLRKYVRSRVLASIETSLSPEESDRATNHRRAEQCISKIKPVDEFGKSFTTTYRDLTIKERMFTRFFWTSVLRSDFPMWVHGRPPRDADPEMSKSYFLGVRPKVQDLQDSQKTLNTSIIEAIAEGFNDGIMPAEVLPDYYQWNPPTSNTLSARVESGNIDWGTKVRHTGSSWHSRDEIWNGLSSGNVVNAVNAHKTNNDFGASTKARDSSGNLNELNASKSGAPDSDSGWDRASTYSEACPLIPNDAVSDITTFNVDRRRDGAGWKSLDVDEGMPLTPPLTTLTGVRTISDAEKAAIPAARCYLPIRPRLPRRLDRDIETALLSERDPTAFPAAEPSEPLVYKGPVWTSDESHSTGQIKEENQTSSPDKTPLKGNSVLTLTRPMTNPLPKTIPGDDHIPPHSAFFNMTQFFLEAKTHIREVAIKMLDTKEMGFDVAITDTLLCLSDEEFQYLPLWAGGNEDGSGGVFDDTIPAAVAGPNGPGPSFHTGFSNTSAASSEFDMMSDRTSSFNTSLAVDDGFSDHIDRRLVVADDDFHSETLSQGSEVHDRKGKGVDRSGFSNGGPSSEVTFSDAGSDIFTFSEADTETLAAESEAATEVDFDMEFVDEDSDVNTTVGNVDEQDEEDSWDGGDAEFFDFGDNDSDEEMGNA